MTALEIAINTIGGQQCARRRHLLLSVLLCICGQEKLKGMQ